MFPAVLILMLFAPEILRLWVGADFAARSTNVMRLLLAGLFLNSVAHVPFVLLQSVNRPDLTGKLHLLELAPYVALVAAGIHYYGLTGAAMVWSLRLGVEAMLLLWLASRTLVPKAIPAKFMLFLAAVSAVLGLCTIIGNVILKLVVCGFVLAGFVLTAWRYILEARERELLARQFELLFARSQSARAAGVRS
jgi:O-antigen/teichoic acid export membrane protein